MNRFGKIAYCIMVIPSIFVMILGYVLDIDIKFWWMIAYCAFVVFFLVFLKNIIQMKKDRPDLGIMEHIRLRKELHRKNAALLKTDGPEELASCILARRELVEQATGADKVIYTMNLAERLFANGELDEAAWFLDSVASKVKGSLVKLVYWNNRIAIEMIRQNEEEAEKMLPNIFENSKRVTGGKKTRKQLDLIYMRASMWQAVIEKRYEEALLLLDEWKKRLDDVASSQDNMQIARQYFLMEKLNVYLKMNKPVEALEVEKELRKENLYPLIAWWLGQQEPGNMFPSEIFYENGMEK
ncbi:MAG: hypothetical protein HDR22_05085 [Lachnospiraceae bacterium]|nr:hypothetical protein [Lachnospiraceae bacterium]